MALKVFDRVLRFEDLSGNLGGKWAADTYNTDAGLANGGGYGGDSIRV
jgi:hypothetical protein